MEPWRSLLEIAIRSPSPHNVQPWRVRITSPATAELLIEKRRTLPREDESGSFIVMSMSLFVEALTLVAAGRGLRLEHELIHPPEWYAAASLEARPESFLPFARLALTADSTLHPPPPDALILARRTSRLPYFGPPIGAEEAAALAASVAPYDHRYGQSSDPTLIEQVLAWNIDAVFEDLNTPAYHDEIASWFRITRRAAEKTRDGLDARCMSASPLELWIAARAPWLLTLGLLRATFARSYRAQIGPVATLGWLSGGFWRAADALVAGRALLHFWLAVTRLGLVIHPYGNLVTHRPMAARCAPLLGVADAWLVFKIGRSAEPAASLRRRFDEVLLD